MANITPRKNKNGEIISYRIRVARGYDSEGKQLTPYSMIWKPELGMTAKRIEKEVQRQATLFEEQCKQGIPSEKIDKIDLFKTNGNKIFGFDASGNSYYICSCSSDDASEYICNVLNFYRDS